MNWQDETAHKKLARLRTAVSLARDDLIEAEAKLTDRMAEVHAFELEFEARVGHFIDQLAAVEAELKEYQRQIQAYRNEQVFGTNYRSVDEQFERTWRVPPKSAPKPPEEPVPPATEAQIKKLYRKLARRFHPDLAGDETERAYRTTKMQAINDAYAARSMVELVALAAEMTDVPSDGDRPSGQSEAEMIAVLEKELARCRGRIQQIETEIRNLHNRPSVELSLEVKLSRSRGHDLLAEMAANLERKIGRKSAERDMIKSQFDGLDIGGRINKT